MSKLKFNCHKNIIFTRHSESDFIKILKYNNSMKDKMYQNVIAKQEYSEQFYAYILNTVYSYLIAFQMGTEPRFLHWGF